TTVWILDDKLGFVTAVPSAELRSGLSRKSRDGGFGPHSNHGPCALKAELVTAKDRVFTALFVGCQRLRRCPAVWGVHASSRVFIPLPVQKPVRRHGQIDLGKRPWRGEI